MWKYRGCILVFKWSAWLFAIEMDSVNACRYIDPHDPTKLYLQQPSESQPTLRRRNYSTRTAEEGQM
jgi:hypothetical protein